MITARAFGANAQQPIPVRVGSEEHVLRLGDTFSTTTLHFSNRDGSHNLVIVPPAPQLSNQDNIVGQAPRKLGIGMAEIRIVPRP